MTQSGTKAERKSLSLLHLIQWVSICTRTVGAYTKTDGIGMERGRWMDRWMDGQKKKKKMATLTNVKQGQ